MRFELLEQYYKSDEYFNKLKARAKILKDMEESEAQHAYWMDRFANTGFAGVILFIEVFAFVKIPEYNNAIKPFFLFPYQKDSIKHIVNAEDDNQDHEILMDKPRGMGITWILVWIMIHHWIFKKEWTAFVLSRTETEVDDGTRLPDNSIFGKIRWSIARLPLWLRPNGFELKDKKGTPTDSNLRILNPQTNAAIIGSSTNANAGRSRRYSFVFMDEAFFVENFMTVYNALQSVSRIKIFVSTVVPGTKFKKLQQMAKQKGDYLSLTWKQHPFKDKQWYDEQMAKAEFNEDILKEIEPSYVISKSSQYYPEISQARLMPLTYTSTLPLYASMDIGKGDMTVIIFYQYDGELIYVISAYANKQRPLDWYMPFIAWWCFADVALAASAMNGPISAIDYSKYNDFQKKFMAHYRPWKKPIAYFGERAHKNRVMPLNKSVADSLIASPYRIRLLVNNMGTEFKPRRLATAKLLPRTIFNSDPSEPYVQELYDALMNSQYAKAENATSPEAGEKPIHTKEIADYRSAFENFSVNFARIIRHHASSDIEYKKKVSGSPFLKGMLGMLKSK